VAQGNLADALASYRSSLAIRERLAKADPGNAGWQRDVAVSHSKLATIHRREGNVANALAALRAGRAIAAALVARAPDHAQWKNDLAFFDRQIAALDKEAEAAPR
jgi:hypothetical protein